jgi:hypothetical protein
MRIFALACLIFTGAGALSVDARRQASLEEATFGRAPSIEG